MSTVVGEVIQLLKPLILPVSCMINFPLHGISDIVSLPVCSVQFIIYLHMFHLVPVSKLDGRSGFATELLTGTMKKEYSRI
jgi:hypothetical protein